MLSRKINRSPVTKLERKNNKGKKFLILAILLVTIILPLLVLNTPIFKVEKLEVTINKINCVSATDLKTNLPTDFNIFTVSEDLILKSVQKKYPCVNKVSIHRMIPNSVNLEFIGREAVLAFKPTQLEEASLSAILAPIQKNSTPSAEATPSSFVRNDQFLVDSSGMVFAQTFETVYVPSILFWDNNLKIGSKLEQRFMSNLLSIFDKLKVFNLPINEVRVYSSGNMIINSSSIVIFNLNRDVQNQLAALQLILDKAKIDEENMVFIDLRFDKPVVKYAPRNK